MIALDTSVLARHLAGDDDRLQSAPAAAMIEQQRSTGRPGVVNRVVLMDLHWRLTQRFATARSAFADLVRALRGAEAPRFVHKLTRNAKAWRCCAAA